MFWFIYTDYLPVYFQAVKVHSPFKSGVDMLELSLTIAPVAHVSGSLIRSGLDKTQCSFPLQRHQRH